MLIKFNPTLISAGVFDLFFNDLAFFVCRSVYYKLFSMLILLNGIFL